jgi:hypothetical protein
MVIMDEKRDMLRVKWRRTEILGEQKKETEGCVKQCD